MKAYIETK